MITDWKRLDKKTILEGVDENGNRYLSRFLKDYKKIFNPQDINAGCQRCLDDYYSKMIKHLSTMKKSKNESGYVLKAKYQNIQLEFGSRILVNNENITAEQGAKLLKDHPRGKELFDKIPEKGTSEEDSKDLSKLKRDQLDKIAKDLGLTPSDYPNKDSIIEAISQVEDFEAETEKGTSEEEE